jgi:lysyl-tRNA synthetase class 1
MSSSKGLGSSAAEVAAILPPELLRFLMVRTNFRQAIDFDPGGMTIPDLFDGYDRCAQEWFVHKCKSDLGRIFELSQIGKIPKKKINYPRFRDVATLVQMPGVDLKKQFPSANQKILEERIKYAKIWLDGYAPTDFIFKIQKKLPQAVKKLSAKQKEYLIEVGKLMKKTWVDEKKLEFELYEAAKKVGLPSMKAFEAIYLMLLGKTHGPKAAALLLSQDKKFLIERIKEAV